MYKQTRNDYLKSNEKKILLEDNRNKEDRNGYENKLIANRDCRSSTRTRPFKLVDENNLEARISTWHVFRCKNECGTGNTGKRFFNFIYNLFF